LAEQRSGGYPSLFGGVQVPELHVAVSCGDEVAVVLGEGDGEDSAGHLVGCDDGTFLLAHGEKNISADRHSGAT